MGILTVILIAMIAWAIYQFLPVLLNKEINVTKTASRLKHIKTIGTFGLLTGILGQLIGLYAAFSVLEAHGDISQSLLAGGLKVSTISTVYGVLIFLLSLLLWFICDNVLTAKSE